MSNRRRKLKRERYRFQQFIDRVISDGLETAEYMMGHLRFPGGRFQGFMKHISRELGESSCAQNYQPPTTLNARNPAQTPS